jgi:hypothetical protein
MRRLNGSALGPLGGGRVTELDMLANIGGGKGRAPSPVCSLNIDCAVVADSSNGPLVAVLDPPPPSGQATLVAAGDNRVTHTHNRAAR